METAEMVVRGVFVFPVIFGLILATKFGVPVVLDWISGVMERDEKDLASV